LLIKVQAFLLYQATKYGFIAAVSLKNEIKDEWKLQ